MIYLPELQFCITVWFKIVRIYARSVPRVHGQKRLDDDTTGWSRHQRLTGQTALTYRSDVFWVHWRQLFWSGKLFFRRTLYMLYSVT